MPPIERTPSFAATPDEDPTLVDSALPILCADFVHGKLLLQENNGVCTEIVAVDPDTPFRLKVEVDDASLKYVGAKFQPLSVWVTETGGTARDGVFLTGE